MREQNFGSMWFGLTALKWLLQRIPWSWEKTNANPCCAVGKNMHWFAAELSKTFYEHHDDEWSHIWSTKMWIMPLSTAKIHLLLRWPSVTNNILLPNGTWTRSIVMHIECVFRKSSVLSFDFGTISMRRCWKHKHRKNSKYTPFVWKTFRFLNAFRFTLVSNFWWHHSCVALKQNWMQSSIWSVKR